MEANTTYQTSEAETEVGNSDDSNYAEMTDETIPECQTIVREYVIQMMMTSNLEIQHKIHVRNKKYFITL